MPRDSDTTPPPRHNVAEKTTPDPFLPLMKKYQKKKLHVVEAGRLADSNIVICKLIDNPSELIGEEFVCDILSKRITLVRIFTGGSDGKHMYAYSGDLLPENQELVFTQLEPKKKLGG